MYQPNVTIASASFAYWMNSLPARRQLEDEIARLTRQGLVHGIEFSVKNHELVGWTNELRNGVKKLPAPLNYFRQPHQERLLELPFNTVHLEPLNALEDGQEEWLAGQLAEIYRSTNIKEFTVHPDGVPIARWQRLLDAVPQGVLLSVENMDLRKATHRTLEEIELLLTLYPRLRFTFDVCHWIEQGREVSGVGFREGMLRLMRRLSKIHFSVPRSTAECYRNEGIETFHFLRAGSAVELPDEFFSLIPEQCPWVIEGVIPVTQPALLEQEIVYLFQKMSLSRLKAMSA